MKMTVKSHLNVKYFTQKTVVLAVVSALMFIVGGFLVKEYKINAQLKPSIPEVTDNPHIAYYVTKIISTLQPTS